MSTSWLRFHSFRKQRKPVLSSIWRNTTRDKFRANSQCLQEQAFANHMFNTGNTHTLSLSHTHVYILLGLYLYTHISDCMYEHSYMFIQCVLFTPWINRMLTLLINRNRIVPVTCLIGETYRLYIWSYIIYYFIYQIYYTGYYILHTIASYILYSKYIHMHEPTYIYLYRICSFNSLN